MRRASSCCCVSFPTPRNHGSEERMTVNWATVIRVTGAGVQGDAPCPSLS
jgi:hypothetical protein